LLIQTIEFFPKIPTNLSKDKTLFTRFIGGPNMAVLNGHEWKEQRKVANPAFHRSMPVKLFGSIKP
jgi:cytochrome P450